jgi:hypothetical protein
MDKHDETLIGGALTSEICTRRRPIVHVLFKIKSRFIWVFELTFCSICNFRVYQEFRINYQPKHPNTQKHGKRTRETDIKSNTLG